mmetsp:Transcript_67442/g.154563  ORF Transcript_67442/g.154563 Transcript_67442/m.154563 type:complete len:258 (-) Transcript_67442:273-1046(-)
MDALEMPLEFGRRVFHVALDKGTLDTIALREGSEAAVSAFLLAVHGVLRLGGTFIHVSPVGPLIRMPQLRAYPPGGWDCSARVLSHRSDLRATVRAVLSDELGRIFMYTCNCREATGEVTLLRQAEAAETSVQPDQSRVDCEGAWGDWQECDSKCMTVRRFDVLNSARHGGQPCNVEDGTIEEQPCSGGSCGIIEQPAFGEGELNVGVACLGFWGPWSSCSDCSRTRHFAVINQAQDGGPRCVHEDGHSETESCCEV